MLAPFPTHVLSVTPEGVRELDGREALSKLWTLFSKCKESIENGRRLENISWRLWYRDMLATIPLDLSESRVGLDGLLKDCETLDEKAYRPPTPMETLLPPPDVAAHFQTLSLGAASPTLASPPTVPRSVPPMLRTRTESFRKPLKPLPVGQIIYDMLPNSSAMAHSPASSTTFVSLSMSSSYGGVTRIPRSESLAPPPASSASGDSNLYLSGTFLPLLPLLPLPERISGAETTRFPASSQLPTPGAERDESAPFVQLQPDLVPSAMSTHPSLAVASNIPVSHTIPSHTKYQDSSLSASSMTPTATLPNIAGPSTAGPPSPSLSDTCTCAHHREATDDHRQSLGLHETQDSAPLPTLTQTQPGLNGDRPSPLLSEPSPQRQSAFIISDNTHVLPTVATPPRLVVVNPTPGPTPHPTPPATPLSMLPPGEGGKFRHGQFLALPSDRVVSSQLAPIPAPAFNQVAHNVQAHSRGTTLNVRSASRSRLNAPPIEFGGALQPSQTESSTNLSLRGQSTPPTQDPSTALPQGQTEGITNQNLPASQNPNRLSTSSTASTSSTTASNTTASRDSSSSQLSIGATSVHTDESSDQQTKCGSLSDRRAPLPLMTPLASIKPSITAPSSPNDATVTTPVSPMMAEPSTSANSIKSARSTTSAAARSARLGKHGAPSLTRRASSGAASAGGGRSRKAGNPSTVDRTASSGASRSRSRDAAGSRKGVGAAAGALAATMGMTTTSSGGHGHGHAAGGKKRLGGAKAGAGKRVALARTASRGGGLSGGAALKRTLSHEEVEEVTDEDEEEEEEVVSPVSQGGVRGVEPAKDHDAVLARYEREIEDGAAAAREAARRDKEMMQLGSARPKFKFGSNSDNGSAAGTEISSRAPGSVIRAPPSGFEALASRMNLDVGDVKGKGRLVERPAQQEEVVATRQGLNTAGMGRNQGKQDAGAVALARVHESLAQPLLPQDEKRTILLTSESEEYTDTDGEDGEDSWTSEDAEGGNAVESAASRQQPAPTRQASQPDAQQRQALLEQQLQAQAQVQAQQQHEQQQQQQQRPAPPPLQRTHSNTSGANRHTRRGWQQQHIQQRREADIRVQRAAMQLQREEEEKRRQKEMFAKKPTTSFQNLTEANRTQSFGYLTQLMNPDPSMLPMNHPYRRGHSSGDIAKFGMTAMTGMAAQVVQATKSAQPVMQQAAPQPAVERPVERQVLSKKEQEKAPQPQPQPQEPPRPRAPRRSATLDDTKRMPPPPPPERLKSVASATEDKGTSTVPPSPVRSESRASISTNAMALAMRGMRSLGFGPKKSAAAGPVPSQVMASSVKPKGVVAPPSIAPDLRSGGSAGSSGYRPKGPLPGQEMEESDSEEEGTNNSVQLSQSVAQDRLRQFAARRGITKPNGALPTQPEGDEIPPWAREQEQQVQAGAQAQLYPEGAEVERTVSGPIPMRHPYNLPVNALPSTPRTTRRQMLKSEMSESLRRQLLWERRQAGVPIRRTTSTGGVAANPKINALNPLRPLTTTPSMVQLRAKGSAAARQPKQQQQQQQQAQAGPSNLRQEVFEEEEGGVRGSGDRERRASTGLQDAHAAEVEDDRKRTAMARNRSWAHDYHTSGW